MELTLIWPKQQNEYRLEEVLAFALKNIVVKQVIREPEELRAAVCREKLRRERILFAVFSGEAGINLKLYEMLEILRMNDGCLKDSIAGILVDGTGEYYTKSM